jgi:hypothetical protein
MLYPPELRAPDSIVTTTRLSAEGARRSLPARFAVGVFRRDRPNEAVQILLDPLHASIRRVRVGADYSNELTDCVGLDVLRLDNAV